MKLYQQMKTKIADGSLRELRQECQWVWRYIWRYRGSVVVHIFLGVLGILMSLGSSIASKYLIDAVIGYNSGIIGLAAALMLGMRLGNIAMRSISNRIGAAINIRVQNEIQGEIFRRILGTDWESLEEYRSGDLLNRINGDASTISGGVTGFIPSLISSGVQFVGSFFIILFYDPVMALITLVGVPLTAICSAALLKRMRNHSKQMKDVYSDVMSFQQDSFQNITSIKAFGMADWFGLRMGEVHETYREKFLEYSRFSVWTSALMNLLSLLAYIACFGWGVYRLWQHEITYGEMTMFMQLSTMLGSAFSSIIGLVPTGISITTSARRIMNVVELPAEDDQLPEDFEQEDAFVLSLKDASFQYKDGVCVLEQANLRAEPGELISLTGPSGEGKTTLLRMMLGLVLPAEGEACLIGGSGRKYPLSAATRRAFGYVPQGNQMISGTIAENLRLGNPTATDEELIDALKVSCAYDFVMALPGGLNHGIGGRDKRLSEGQTQRLAVARALVRKAPILLLDEATSALDMELEAALLTNLMESGMLKTCILVTHRPAGRELCDRSYHVQDGIVREEEP